METSGSAPGVTPEGAWNVFAELEDPRTPRTTAEIATNLDCTEDAAREHLLTLVERGDLEAKQIDAPGRIWWRSETGTEPSGHSPRLEEFVETIKTFKAFWLSVVRLPPSEDA